MNTGRGIILPLPLSKLTVVNTDLQQLQQRRADAHAHCQRPDESTNCGIRRAHRVRALAHLFSLGSRSKHGIRGIRGAAASSPSHKSQRREARRLGTLFHGHCPFSTGPKMKGPQSTISPVAAARLPAMWSCARIH